MEPTSELDLHLGIYRPATAAALNDPVSVAVDGFGNLYIADSSNSRVGLSRHRL